MESVWIGLAHARPTEDNQEPALEGAAGAYVNVLAWAESREEFEERVRDALEDEELELLELDDAEPLSVRLESFEVSRELLELAVDVAHTRGVRFDDFRIYATAEDDEDGDREESPGGMLRRALELERVVELWRDYTRVPLRGFVVAVGEDWALLHQVTDGIELDGFAAVRIADVDEVETLDEDAFVPRALALRDQHPATADVAIGDLRALLDSAQRLFPLVSVYTEHEMPNARLVGRVDAFEDEMLAFQEIDTEASWTGVNRYGYADVTRVDFGGRYEDALWAVASERP